MVYRKLHTGFLWLYGVILGLAIREALNAVVPKLLPPPVNGPFPWKLEAFRLVVFLTIAARFYLGSIVYFEETYASGDAVSDQFAYRLDAFSSGVHFLVIYVLALSLAGRASSTAAYPLLLFLVLFYDVAWYEAARSPKGRKQIRYWMYLNLGTLFLAELAWVGASKAFGYRAAEPAALTIVLLISLGDLSGTITGRHNLEGWLKSLKGWLDRSIPDHRPVESDDSDPPP